MRPLSLLVILTLAWTPSVRAQTAPGPSEQTLVWWRAPARPFSDQPLPAWAEANSSKAIVPLVGWLGEEPGLALVARATVWAFVRGHPATGEVLIASECPAPEEESVRSAWLIVSSPEDARGPEKLLAAMFGEAGAPSVETADLDGFPISRSMPEGWATPIYWSVTGNRIILATTQRAYRRATAGQTDEADPIRTDSVALADAVAKSHRGGLEVLSVYANVNAFRRDFEDGFTFRRDVDGAFIFGRGVRLLEDWKFSNVRGLGLVVGIADPSRGRGGADLVTVDVAYSARSDKPGIARSIALTLDEFPPLQGAARVPGMSALVVFRSNLARPLEWVIKTYRDTLQPDAEKAFALTWATWLSENRPKLVSVNERMGSTAPVIILGLDRGMGNGRPEAVVQVRIPLLFGSDAEQTARDIGELTRWVDRVEKRDKAGGPLWSARAGLPWLQGGAAWCGRKFGETPLVAGSVTFGDADPVEHLLPPQPPPLR